MFSHLPQIIEYRNEVDRLKRANAKLENEKRELIEKVDKYITNINDLLTENLKLIHKYISLHTEDERSVIYFKNDEIYDHNKKLLTKYLLTDINNLIINYE